jgi:YidC/Oxa1 family membrane protein insertase
MEFGPIKPLIYNVMLPFLEFSYNSIYPNYGVAIILLTIIIKLAFFPLMQKQYKSMKAMQVLSPEMQNIREKYKSNPQKLQLELLALYKKHNVNPLAGCLPMLIQIPFFLAIYSTINSEAFKALISQEGINHGLFTFWLADLSIPDSTYILPIILAGFTYWSQKLMVVDKNQMKLLILSPILILVFGLKLPSGVLLYWAASTVLSTIQQHWVLSSKSNDTIKNKPLKKGEA